MPLTDSALSYRELQKRLAGLMLRDERRLRRRLDGAPAIRDPAKRSAAFAKVAAEVDAAAERVARRLAGVPVPRYPDDLPVTARKDDILAAIRDSQVVIVAGETGSGKTTQLPKFCLELGRGVRGMIGHTQPRRIAARTVADRIAEELGTAPGTLVGHKMRFTDSVGDDTLVKVMTDGILLAEIQSDPTLSQYDTIIIDEAHERSLNVDFLLGYLKQLLPRRPDLKLVITSATIDPERFARHFGGAPIVEVSGRTYPVETRYRPIDDRDADQVQAIGDAVDEFMAEGPGDILVFLSGEREIRDTADALRAQLRDDVEVLPLYARLSAAEQHRVFERHDRRRVVLATNVAETSLTVPGIRYVVDPGTARISRYSRRLKVQRLPIEPISQASANQRKGRCGRLGPGVCIRLYAADDFAGRPEFTDPEILRTNLASVILQMAALGLGDMAAFPFIDPPDRRSVRDGIALLEELGAFVPGESDPRKRLTPLGRQLAALPVDPRLGRMVVEAGRNGCARDVLVVAAALSIQDPRERPADQQQAADDAHRRFADERSDFLGYLNLWRYLQEQQRAHSSSRFRRLCKAEFLHYLRVREWQDLFAQLRQVARGLGIVVADDRAEPAPPDLVHRSLLAGLLSHIGVKTEDRHEYLGARGARFALFPGSVLFKKAPRFVMAAELVETSRLYARVVARIEPEWAEQLAEHLVVRTYSEPHWERKRGAVMAYERVTLYGVPIVVGRRVGYGRVDPELSRELFIRHALVEGDWDTHYAFFARNAELVADVAALEERARRRDILVGDETLFAFYDERIPADVVSARHFDAWWKAARRDRPDLLDFTTDLLVAESAGDVDASAYPDSWRAGGMELPLAYSFEPGTESDGVTVRVPLSVLNRVDAEAFEWHVPGLREELVTELIRGLPKNLRRNFVPAPDVARELVKRLRPGDGSLLDAMSHELLRMTGVAVPRDAWQPQRLPAHLRTTFRIEDPGGEPLAEGKDLPVLKKRLARRMSDTLSAAAKDIERSGLQDWSFGEVPRTFAHDVGGHVVRGYPALVDEGDSVALRVLPTVEEQRQSMWRGTRRLLSLSTPSPVKAVLHRLPNDAKLALRWYPYATATELFDDCVTAALDAVIDAGGGPAWDATAFARLREVARRDLVEVTYRVVTAVRRVVDAAREVDALLADPALRAHPAAVADVRDQLERLAGKGSVTAAGTRRLGEIERYLRAAQRRLQRMPLDPDRDRLLMARAHEAESAYAALLDRLPEPARRSPDATAVRWMLEELRVSLFAQVLGTPYPVSEKRIYTAMDALERP